MNENFMKVNAKIFCILKTERAIEIEDFGFQNSVLFFVKLNMLLTLTAIKMEDSGFRNSVFFFS